MTWDPKIINAAKNPFFVINGKVTDQDGEPIELATVILTDVDGKPLPVNGNVVGRKTDANGKFIIPITGSYRYLTISAVGYQKKTIPGNIYVKNIVLEPSTNDLKEVKVSANKIYGTKIPKPNKKPSWPLFAFMGAMALLTIIVVYKISK